MIASRPRRPMRRGFLSRRRCCCAPAGVCVVACSPGVALAGASLSIAGVGSCTTDATGCCPSLSASGTHAYTVTLGPDTVGSGSWNFSAGPTIAIPGPTDGKCCQGVYIPTTLTATDAIGTFAMAFWRVDGAGNFQWTGGHSATKSSLPSCPTGTVSSGPVPVCYTFTCVLSGSPAKYTLQRSWSTVNTLATGDIYWQQSYTFTPGGLCTFGPPGLCSSHNDESDGQTNAVAGTTPFAVNFATMAAALANVTTDPIGGSVAISQ
jgi:hypothetical protein